MKEVPYFSHDSNARNDLKIAALIEDHEIEAYGIYWVIIEMLREQDEYKLPWGIMSFKGIAKAVGKKGETAYIQALIMEMCDPNKYDLLKKDTKHFWSESLISRMKVMQEKMGKFSKAGKASAEARQERTAALTKEKLLKDVPLQEGICGIYNLTPKLFKDRLKEWIKKEEQLGSLTRPYPEVKRHLYNSLNLELNGSAAKNGNGRAEEKFTIPERK
jgi:hypothetical protein